MPMTIYMSVTGAKQGEIKPDSELSAKSEEHADQKGKILVYKFNHTIGSADSIDKYTGLTTGHCLHKPLIVTKARDVASPKLAQMCCTRERSAVELCFFRTIEAEEKVYFKIKLEEANLIEMQAYTPMTFLQTSEPYKDMEELSFTYSKITWHYVDGNIEYTDSWRGK